MMIYTRNKMRGHFITWLWPREEAQQINKLTADNYCLKPCSVTADFDKGKYKLWGVCAVSGE